MGAAGRDREQPRATRGAARQREPAIKLGRILPIAVGLAVIAAAGGYVFMGKQQEQQKQKRARAFQDQPAPVLVAPARNARRADLSRRGRQHQGAQHRDGASAGRRSGGQDPVPRRAGREARRCARRDRPAHLQQFDQAVAKKAQDEATLANVAARSRPLHAGRRRRIPARSSRPTPRRRWSRSSRRRCRAIRRRSTIPARC